MEHGELKKNYGQQVKVAGIKIKPEEREPIPIPRAEKVNFTHIEIDYRDVTTFLTRLRAVLMIPIFLVTYVIRGKARLV